MPIVSKLDDNTEYEVPEGTVLFEALDDQGVKLKFGCLAGSCSVCKILVTEGAENLKAASFIESNTIESVHENYSGKEDLNTGAVRLACRCIVTGDIKFKPLE